MDQQKSRISESQNSGVLKYEGLIIEHLIHDCFKIKTDKVIYIDPFQLGVDEEKADLILITHEHYDHCSPGDISKIVKPETIVVATPDCQSKISNIDVKKVILVEPGKKIEVLAIPIEAIPAYNIDKWRAPNVSYHPKETLMVGYVFSLGGKILYHAGDTDVIPEMKSLGEIDVAFLPVSGTYVMTSAEAVAAVEKIKPKLAIPMHYGAIVGSKGDAESFKQRASCRVEII